MSEKTNPIETAEDEFEAIMPEGWTGNDDADIFDPSTWGDADPDADVQEDDEAEGDGASVEGDDDAAPTTGDGAEPMNGSEEEDGAPTTGDYTSEGKLRFQATVDHTTREVELDPADLPTVYQKSLALDRYQQRVSELEAEQTAWDQLAAGLNFEDRNALLNGLMENAVQDYIAEHPSVPEEMARDFVMRKFQGVKTASPAKEAEPAPAQRDFKAEVAELFRTHPEARTEKIPDEVTNDAISMGKPLVQAYAEWKARTASAKATRAERENKILKQNQAAAARAPVTKTTGGGKTDTKPVDDFLRGFNDDAAW